MLRTDPTKGDEVDSRTLIAGVLAALNGAVALALSGCLVLAIMSDSLRVNSDSLFHYGKPPGTEIESTTDFSVYIYIAIAVCGPLIGFASGITSAGRRFTSVVGTIICVLTTSVLTAVGFYVLFGYYRLANTTGSLNNIANDVSRCCSMAYAASAVNNCPNYNGGAPLVCQAPYDTVDASALSPSWAFYLLSVVIAIMLLNSLIGVLLAIFSSKDLKQLNSITEFLISALAPRGHAGRGAVSGTDYDMMDELMTDDDDDDDDISHGSQTIASRIVAPRRAD